MLPLRQGSGQRHNRVTGSHEGNLERLGLINLNHVPYYEECERNAVMFDAFHDTPIYAVGGQAPYYDTAPDLFHFDFCGHRGDFVILEDGTVRAYDTDLPYGEFDIVFSATDAMSPEVAITLSDGTEYRFGGTWENLESSHSRPCGQESLRPVFGLGVASLTSAQADDITSTTVTALHLYQVTAPNGRTVRFHRGAPTSRRLWELFMTADFIDKGNVQSGRTVTTISNACSSPLDSVTVDGRAVVAFSYEQKTVDEDDARYFWSDEMGVDSNFQGLSFHLMDRRRPSVRLSGIEVRNASGELVERVSLTHRYAESGTPRMFLSSASSLRNGTHAFEYNLAGFTLPKSDDLGFDHWGYWNGKSHSDVRGHLLFDQDGVPVDDLYGQMADSQKDADPAYSVCGSLRRIVYPTGGDTVVEYEGNRVGRRIRKNHTLQECTPYTVGGIRVMRTTDRDGSGRADTTRFLYPSGSASGGSSGILMQMPLHALDTRFFFEELYQIPDSPVPSTGLYRASVHSVTYSNKGYFNMSRDHHVAYESVSVVHPDGSRTAYQFNVEGDQTGGGTSMGKHVFPNEYWTTLSLTSTTDTGPLVVGDRKSLRGRPEYVRTYDAEGHLVKTLFYDYVDDVVTVGSVLFNEPEQYTRCSFSVTSPRLLKTVMTENLYDESGAPVGSFVRKDWTSYNAAGQPRIQWTETPSDTLYTYYRYINESGLSSPSGYDRLMSDAARTRKSGGREYLLAAERYDYGIAGNPHPTRITEYDLGDGVDVTGLDMSSLFSAAGSRPVLRHDCEYDVLGRLTRVSSPGGAWTSYTWAGNNVASRTENGTDNRTLYRWKDLVGLSGTTELSGREESYEYDARNRLYKIVDTDGNTMSATHYHLRNE